MEVVAATFWAYIGIKTSSFPHRGPADRPGPFLCTHPALTELLL